MEVKSVQEFIEWLSSIETSSPFGKNELFYRGQANKDWAIIPYVFRTIEDETTGESFKYNEALLLEHAMSEAWSVVCDCSSPLERLVRFQHFELATRILDVSYDPLVALYFACSNSKEKDNDGAVYFGNTNGMIFNTIVNISAQEAFDGHPNNISDDGIVNRYPELFQNCDRSERLVTLLNDLKTPHFSRPPYNNNRIKAQKGAFVISPVLSADDSGNGEHRWFSGEVDYRSKKYDFGGDNRSVFDETPCIIPARKKKEILKQLSTIGITEDRLFPDKIDEQMKNIMKKSKVEVTGRGCRLCMSLKKIATLVVLLFAMTNISSAQSHIQIGNLFYSIQNGSATVIGYYSPLDDGSINIPYSVTYNGQVYTVTSIGEYAFHFCTGLTSVTIGSSVTSIGEHAFYSCTGLTSVTIGSSVTSIGSSAFENCDNLITVNYTGTIAQWCGIDFIYYNSNPIYYSHSLKINGSPVMNLVIPNGVTEIKKHTFYNCSSLTSVTIPNSVASIGASAFDGCTGLTSVAFNADSCASAGTEDWSIHGPFGFCTNITTFTFGNNVKIIPSYLLSGVTGLTSITIPNSVISIGSYAFYQCTGLTSVTIPNSVTSIGARAFGGCTGLTSVAIPNSVTSIGSCAFENCTGLTSVTIPNSVKNIGSGAFSHCTSLESFFLNADSCVFEESYGYHGAFGGCSFLSSVIIGDTVTYICENAFGNCDQLINITLGSGVQSISQGVFYGCTSLARIKSYATQPPLVQSNTFSVLSNDVILNVPCGYGSIYDNTAIWHNFDIQEDLMYTFSATPGNPARGTVGVIHAPECSNLQAEVQAYPYNGFHFARWSDGNTEAHRYLVVLQDTAIEAIFLAEGETEGIDDVNTDGISVWSTNGRIHVSLDGEPVKEFHVYDLMGREVFHAKHAPETPALPRGVYLVKVGTLPAKKVVVIR